MKIFATLFALILSSCTSDFAVADPLPPGTSFRTGKPVIICDTLAQVTDVFNAALTHKNTKAGVDVFMAYNKTADQRGEKTCVISKAAGMVVSFQVMGILEYGIVVGVKDQDSKIWAVEYRIEPSSERTLWMYYPEEIGQGT